MKFLSFVLLILGSISSETVYGAALNFIKEEGSSPSPYSIKNIQVVEARPSEIFEKKNGDFLFLTSLFEGWQPKESLLQTFSISESRITHEQRIPYYARYVFLREDNNSLLFVHYSKEKWLPDLSSIQSAFFLDLYFDGTSQSPKDISPFTEVANISHDFCNMGTTLEGEKILYYIFSINTLEIFSASKQKTHSIPITGSPDLIKLRPSIFHNIIFNKQGDKIYTLLNKTTLESGLYRHHDYFSIIDLPTSSIRLLRELFDDYQLGSLSKDGKNISLLAPAYGTDLVKIMNLQTYEITHTIQAGRCPLKDFFINDDKELLIVNDGSVNEEDVNAIFSISISQLLAEKGPNQSRRERSNNSSIRIVDLKTEKTTDFLFKSPDCIKARALSRDGKNLFLSFTREPLQIISFENSLDTQEDRGSL